MLVQRLPNPSRENEERVRHLFERIRREFQNRDINSHTEMKQRLMELFSSFFKSAGQAHYTFESIDPDSPRLSSLWNKIMDTIGDDIDVAYKETEALLKSALETFNYRQAQVKSVDAALARAVSALQDLEIITKHATEPVFVAGDNFKNSNRIDMDATLTNPLAELPAYQNSLVLRRTASVNLFENASDIDIAVSTEGGARVTPYEGRMFALMGEAEPEGGTFRFKTGTGYTRLVGPKVPYDLLDRYKNYLSSNPGTALMPKPAMEKMKDQDLEEFEGFTKEEWEYLMSSVHEVGELFQLPPRRSVTFQLTEDEDTFIYDAGATEEEKKALRRRMIDQDPDSYWQIEYVADTQESLVPWAEADSEGIPIVISKEMQRAAETAIDSKLKFDFVVVITIDLKKTQQLNWISLVPMLFSGGDDVRVLDIATSTDGKEYHTLEGWEEGKYDNILTDDVNEELTSEERAVTLSPSRYAYEGTGLWTFSPVRARFIRFKLEQREPELSPYNLVSVIVKDTKKVTSRRKVGFGNVKRKTRTEIKNSKVELSYPESLWVLDGENVSNDFINTPSDRASWYDQLGPACPKFGSSGGHVGVRRWREDKTEITDQITITKWDKARYAVGIKEIGAYTHAYEERSEMVSLPFQFPRPIEKVYLKAAESIPKSFGDGDWIEYYVAFGESNDWVRIAPLSAGTKEVPKVVNVNSSVEPKDRMTTEAYVDLPKETRSLRARVVLKRPADNELATPVLDEYKFVAYTR